MDHNFVDIENNEAQSIGFDFKGFLFKALNLWKGILLCVIVALVVAYLINVRKQNIYLLDSLITVESDQNPFFTANTSISFNWGGVSGKVGKVMTSVKTRSHNELVVDSLKYYLQYLEEGKYRKIDIYKKAPFTFQVDVNKPQVLNYPIRIIFKNENEFEVYTNFEVNSKNAQIYSDKSYQMINVPQGEFRKTFAFGELFELPFLSGKIFVTPNRTFKSEDQYYIKFLKFDNVVSSYQQNVKIESFNASASSVLKLSLLGNNKSKIADYLNATTSILSRTELERKNLYATNTIKFIDSSLGAVDENLKAVTDRMNTFRKQNKVFDLDDEMIQISEKLKEFEKQKEEARSKLSYLNTLENYLLTKTDYTKIAAPTSVGINEVNILSSVSKITNLSIERQNLENSTKEGSVLLTEIDSRIDAEKNVLLETARATKETINYQLNSINRNSAVIEAKLNELPEDQQEYLKIQRELDISQEAYNIYMTKRGEAAIVKAANVSDITVIDEAKDIGNAPVGPRRSLNYMLALIAGFFSPMFLIFVIFLLDNTIHGSDEVLKLSNVPILGLIGKYKYKNNLVVYEKPKSAVAESFRAIRSSLQFIFKKNASDTRANTLMITSSVSGEGKTFTSINIATVYALSDKKTILVGLDLRKPKSLMILILPMIKVPLIILLVKVR